MTYEEYKLKEKEINKKYQKIYISWYMNHASLLIKWGITESFFNKIFVKKERKWKTTY